MVLDTVVPQLRAVTELLLDDIRADLPLRLPHPLIIIVTISET